MAFSFGFAFFADFPFATFHISLYQVIYTYLLNSLGQRVGQIANLLYIPQVIEKIRLHFETPPPCMAVSQSPPQAGQAGIEPATYGFG
ncbi:MAG: hypothetical protein V3S14_06210, partial [Anaerolineae bacterium]